MEENFVAWETTARGGLASFTELENVPKGHLIAVGVSLQEGFPDDAAYRMNPGHKKDKTLPGAARTADGDAVPVVSPELREFIQEFEPRGVEFLPVTVYDHKGKVASNGYSIMNPTLILDCLDQEAMSIEWNPLDKTSIMECDTIVLSAAAVADAPPIFRIKHLENLVVVRRDIAEKAKEQFTGLYCSELSEYTV